MVEFVCDDKKIEIVLRKLYKQVIANGGVLHEKLTVVSKKGDLLVTISEEIPEGEEIITLPKECLLPVDKFKLDIDGCKIVMLSHDKDLNEERIAMMRTMIELFNLTGKIENQKNTSTFSLQYEDKQLLDRVLKCRSENGIPFLEGREDMSKKTYYLESFLMTRTLSIKEGRTGVHSKEFIMPFIEFLNHHARAARYIPSYAETSGSSVTPVNEVTHISVAKSCSVKGSNECYVSYGPYDSMDALIQYNYPDESAFFVRSVPVQIDLPDGKGVIKIRSITSEPQHCQLPKNLKDLKFYIPDIAVSQGKDIIALNFLYIPFSNAPSAMRRVLALAISRLELDLKHNQMLDILQYAEARVIDENIKYYEELLAYLKTYKAKPALKLISENIRHVVAIQLKHIKNYKLLG